MTVIRFAAVIRPAAWTDLDALVSLERETFHQQAWSRPSLEREFAGVGDDRHLTVAEAGSAVVGYGVLSHTGDTSDLRRMAVAGHCRRQGIGSRLLAELLELARRHGCRRTQLEVAADNQPAMALYERSGFGQIARRPRYYADGADAVVLRIELPIRAAAPTIPARREDVGAAARTGEEPEP